MPRPLAVLGIAVFVVVDLALIGAAVAKVNSEPPASPTVAASPTSDDDQNISAQTAYDFSPRASGSLYVGDGGRLITGLRGACDGGSGGEVRTADSAKAGLADRDSGLREILAVRIDGDRLIVAGADETCTLRQRSSTDGGATWIDDLNVDLWHVDPRNERAITTPKDTKTLTSCTVISLSQVDDDFGRVACADGSVFGTGDQGGTWRRLGRLDNIRVISFPSPDEGYALARYQGCAANAFRTTDGGRTWKALDCITGDPARAIAATDDGLTAIVGSTTSLYTSPDGRDWESR